MAACANANDCVNCSYYEPAFGHTCAVCTHRSCEYPPLPRIADPGPGSDWCEDAFNGVPLDATCAKVLQSLQQPPPPLPLPSRPPTPLDPSDAHTKVHGAPSVLAPDAQSPSAAPLQLTPPRVLSAVLVTMVCIYGLGTYWHRRRAAARRLHLERVRNRMASTTGWLKAHTAAKTAVVKEEGEDEGLMGGPRPPVVVPRQPVRRCAPRCLCAGLLLSGLFMLAAWQWMPILAALPPASPPASQPASPPASPPASQPASPPATEQSPLPPSSAPPPASVLLPPTRRAIDACAAESLTKVSERLHTKYFALQQAAHQRLLHDIPAVLCGSPVQDESTYQAALHGLLKPLRRAASKHVHAALYLNAACGITGEDVYNEPMDFFCTSVILAHEPHNTVEGDLLIHFTNHLLRRGPDFCTEEPPLPLRLANWSARLEAAMAGHRGNGIFSLFAKRWEMTCDQEHGRAAAVQRVVSETVPEMTRRVEDEIEECCSMASVGCNISVDETLSSIGNDTALLLGAAKHALLKLGALDRCVPEGECRGPMCSDSRVTTASLSAATKELLRGMREADDERGTDFLSFFVDGCNATAGFCMAPFADEHSTSEHRVLPDWLSQHLMFTVAYHKHSPMCGRPDIGRRKAGAQWMRCGMRGTRSGDAAERLPYQTFFEAWPWEYDGSIPDALPMYDVHPSPDVARCHGKLCREAAAAVDDYIQMQAHVASLRTGLLRLLYPKPMGTIASQMKLLGNFSRHGEWFVNRLTFAKSGAAAVQVPARGGAQGHSQGKTGGPGGKLLIEKRRRLMRGAAGERGRREEDSFDGRDCEVHNDELDHNQPQFRHAAFAVPIVPPTCQVLKQYAERIGQPRQRHRRHHPDTPLLPSPLFRAPSP